jgi:hypothetical protein
MVNVIEVLIATGPRIHGDESVERGVWETKLKKGALGVPVSCTARIRQQPHAQNICQRHFLWRGSSIRVAVVDERVDVVLSAGTTKWAFFVRSQGKWHG